MFEVKEKKLRGHTFIDLFSGIGGFHLALESYGAECVFASEINVRAAEIYERNFGLTANGDITKIKNEQIPEHDILCAGFPCQPFSISGKKRGFNDPNGNLFFEIIRIAEFHKPKLILLENVKNIKVHDNGTTLKTIVESLEKIGYTVFRKVLSASDFCVPQERKRMYFVAFRNDIDSRGFTFPTEINDRIYLRDVLENEYDNNLVIDREYDIDLKLEEKNKNKRLIRIGSIGKGRQGERIYSINGFSTTLSSQGGGIGGKTGLYYTNGDVRRLSPRECARVMGFPESFILSDFTSESYKQFGNSVAVNVIQEILKNVSTILEVGD